MKKILKKLLPFKVISFYHKVLVVLANIIYLFPSHQLIVIGVTGTKGKSTTSNMIWQILTQAGHKTGIITTANFRIGQKEWINNTKMTMPGRFRLQKLLRQMVRAKCEYAVVETSSEGIKQNRHWGIKYQIAVFTNLTPEHIEAHGGFENYRAAKAELFKNLAGLKISILNHDDVNFNFFKNIPAHQYIYYGLETGADLEAHEIKEVTDGFEFIVKGHRFYLPLLGSFNIQNALAALAVGKALEINWLDMIKAIHNFSYMPGRMEKIISRKGFIVYVDYAHTPESLEAVYKSLKPRANRLIAVLGSCGGGRDKAKRPILGKLAATYAKVVIITNEDPYDEDPGKIIDEVYEGTKGFPSTEIFRVFDRREAINQAINQAKVGDIVIITGKGSEQVLVSKNEKMPWDDREVVRQALAML
jgi:UDP-N-acetylmuramoyl-L-alanyl-D-glutamate--2,6-diaminopimelate ligase